MAPPSDDPPAPGFPRRAFVQVFDEVPTDYVRLVEELQRRDIPCRLLRTEELRAGQAWSDADPLTKKDLVVGDFEWTRAALKTLGIAMPDPPDYPACLEHLLHRRIYQSTLQAVCDDIRGLASTDAHQVFVKPSEDTKAFSAVVEPRDQMVETLIEGIPGAIDPLPGSMKVHCADVVEIVSESRVYVVHGAVRQVCEYHPADDEKFPDAPKLDMAVVDDAVRRLAASADPDDAATATGCGIDMMVMRGTDGMYRTALVEVNDGYSLGVYNELSGGDYLELLSARWQTLVGGA